MCLGRLAKKIWTVPLILQFNIYRIALSSQDWTIDTELLYLANCFEGTNCMKQIQFNFNKFNFASLISNTFNTHVKKQHYHTLGQHRIISSGNCMEGANYMKQMQFNCNKCNSTFVLLNTFNTHRVCFTFLWQLFQGSQLYKAKAFVKLNTFQPWSKKGKKLEGKNCGAFSKSEIKHGFHNIISITQRMAAMNKK